MSFGVSPVNYSDSDSDSDTNYIKPNCKETDVDHTVLAAIASNLCVKQKEF